MSHNYGADELKKDEKQALQSEITLEDGREACISFKSAARVFFDYDRIELYDEENSEVEDRYNTIGDLSAGKAGLSESGADTIIGNINLGSDKEDILFVVYTERVKKNTDGKNVDVTRLISARYATNFERGLYYGKY